MQQRQGGSSRVDLPHDARASGPAGPGRPTRPLGRQSRACLFSSACPLAGGPLVSSAARLLVLITARPSRLSRQRVNF